MLHITAHLENYNVAIYYTPTGERHYTYDYVLSLQKSPNAPLGFTFCGFSCTCQIKEVRVSYLFFIYIFLISLTVRETLNEAKNKKNFKKVGTFFSNLSYY